MVDGDYAVQVAAMLEEQGSEVVLGCSCVAEEVGAVIVAVGPAGIADVGVVFLDVIGAELEGVVGNAVAAGNAGIVAVVKGAVAVLLLVLRHEDCISEGWACKHNHSV